jgi:hypothetical protein
MSGFPVRDVVGWDCSSCATRGGMGTRHDEYVLVKEFMYI